MSNHAPLRCIPLALVISFLAQPALADIEEIVVTAQKREQSIRDVPFTVSAFSGEFLKELDISRYDEISDLTPGLVVQQQSVNNNGYVIRGITSDTGDSTAAPRVSVYLNGADVSRSRASYFEVYDMERVEVVKGPQATLFGTASSVGAMSFITNKPQQEFEGEITVGAGDLSSRKANGFITGGTETVQGRLAFLYKERDGYIKNNSNEDDLNGYDRVSVRPSLRFTPNEDVTIDLVYTHDRARDSGTAFVNQALLYTDNAYLSVPSNTILGHDDVGVDRDVDDINLSVRWQINDSYTLSYIGANRDYESLEAFDADGIRQEFLNFAEDAEGEINSHELRLNFSADNYNGFVGVSHFADEASQRVGFIGDEYLFLACAGVLPGGCQSPAPIQVYYEAGYTNKADNDSLSVFGDISFDVSEQLQITAGLRWTTEDRWSAYSSNLPNSIVIKQLTGQDQNLFAGRIPNTQGQQISDSLDDNMLMPRFSLRYALNDNHNAYMTLSKGQRSKVLEMSSGRSKTIAPEKVDNIEFGIKGSLAEANVNYTLALFYQSYKNFRVSVLNDAGAFISQSAGKASNLGVEAEGQWQLNEQLRLFGNFAYIDAKVDNDAKNGRYAGNRFRLQPKLTGALGFLGNWAINDQLNLTAQTTLTHRSSVFFNIANTYEQDAVTLVKAKVGIATADLNWSLELFANNLFDKEYLIDAGNTGASFGLPTYIEGAPRTWGIQAKKLF